MVSSEGYREGMIIRYRVRMLICARYVCPMKHLICNNFLNSFVRSILHVQSIEQEQAYFHERILKQQSGKTFFYGIFDKNTQVLCGAIEIRDPLEHRGQLYCWLNEAWWAKGYIQEAIVLLSHYYFAQTKATYITAFVDATNQRSYWALKRVGFADSAKSEGPHGNQYELLLRNTLHS